MAAMHMFGKNSRNSQGLDHGSWYLTAGRGSRLTLTWLNVLLRCCDSVSGERFMTLLFSTFRGGSYLMWI